MEKKKQPHVWNETLLQLKKNKALCRKYAHAGIYSISINNKVVYIGKSRDMLCRLAQHIFYINNPAYNQSHKYRILNLAKFMGYDIHFDVIYISSTSGNVDDDIGMKEGEYIRALLPPLNYQIPNKNNYHHFTVNKKAKNITLMEILGN